MFVTTFLRIVASLHALHISVHTDGQADGHDFKAEGRIGQTGMAIKRQTDMAKKRSYGRRPDGHGPDRRTWPQTTDGHG